MALVQINIPALQAAVDALAAAIRDMPDAAAGVKRRLDYVWLIGPGLPTWTPGGSAEAELRDILADLRRRLQMAQDLQRSQTHGLGGGPVPTTVWLDEDALDDQDARRVVDLVQQYGQTYDPVTDVPQDLLDLLDADGDDPEFQKHLATLLDPLDLAGLLSTLNAQDRRPEGPAIGPGTGTSAFEARFDQLITGLGQALGAGVQQLPSKSQEQVSQKWADAFKNAPAAAPVLSLVVSRGAWPDVFLTDVADSITDAENRWASGLLYKVFENGDPPESFWDHSGAVAITDPGQTLADGTPIDVLDPMYGVWMAARANPGWMAKRYLGGPTTSVDYDQGGRQNLRGQVPAALWDLFDTRGTDTAGLAAFAQAASVSDLSASLAGDTQSIMSDVQVVQGAFALKQREYDAESDWQKYHHQILAAIATVAGVGAIFASGTLATPFVAAGLTTISAVAIGADLVYDIAEGDIVGAIVDGVCLLPVVFGAVGLVGESVRYVKLMQFTRAQVEALKAGQVVTVLGSRMMLVDGVVTNIDQLPAQAFQSLRLSQPALGAADGGTGEFAQVTRSPAGLAYQSRVVNSPVTGSNTILEYRQPYDAPPGKQPYVDFDGHGWADGHQIFVDAKDGYQFPLVNSPAESLQTSQLERFADEAAAQLAAARQADPDSIVIWACSNSDVAPIIANYFDLRDIDVVVLYVP